MKEIKWMKNVTFIYFFVRVLRHLFLAVVRLDFSVFLFQFKLKCKIHLSAKPSGPAAIDFEHCGLYKGKSVFEFISHPD